MKKVIVFLTLCVNAIGLPSFSPHGRLSQSQQDHGTEIAFQNIWIRIF